jgi:FkbM family methyltransferase
MDFIYLHKLSATYPIVRIILNPFINLRKFLKKDQDILKKKIARNISELIEDDPIMQVSEFQGKFLVNKRSDLFFRLITEYNYEPELAWLCNKYIDTGRDAIDIGANIGFYTVLFAKCLDNGRRVLSIEPVRNALQFLYRNIELNGVISKVDVFEGAASNINGLAKIKTIKGKEEYSCLGSMKHPSVIGEIYEKEDVVTTTIDKLVIEKSLDPGFIKIDVEGAEYNVLKGTSWVLKEYRPIILSELSDFLLKENGSSAKEVIDFIRNHEYDIYDPLSSSTDVGWKKFGDIICFPKELGIKFLLMR